MVQMIVNIRDVNSIPLLPLILKGLKINIQSILLYSENLPASVKQFIETQLGIKVKLVDSCSSYNYILEISGLRASDYKLVHKKEKLLLLLNKPTFVPNDLRIQKLGQSKIFTDLDVKDKNCRKLNVNDWLTPLMQSNNKVGKLIKAFLTEPLPEFLQILRSKKDYSVIYNLIIQRLQTGTNTLMFSNIEDFTLALVITAIINLIYLQHYEVKLNDELVCEPVFENHNLLCKRTKILRLDDLQKHNQRVEQHKNEDIKDNIDATTKQAPLIVENQSNEQSNKQEQPPLSNEENDLNKNIQDKKDVAKEKTEDVKADKDTEQIQKKTNPMEIDVEKWALRIQEMLGS